MIRPVSQLGFGFGDAGSPPGAGRARRPGPRRGPRGPKAERSAPEPSPQLGLAIETKDMSPTLAGQIRLEEALRERIDPFVMVRLTENISTMISFKRRGRVLYVRAHAMFAEAPEPVLDALADFITEPEVEPRQAKLLDEWIALHKPQLAQRRAEQPIQPYGEHHDLQAIFDRVNQQYFAGEIEARITWSIAASKKRRSSIKMGSWCAEQRLVRLHPALDQDWVPEMFVEFVVYHEMLHALHGVTDNGSGRREVHTPAFRADEKKYAHYAAAMRWERDHLTRLLKY